MISNFYFLIRLTEKGTEAVRDLGLEDEDLFAPRIWSQEFDLRVCHGRTIREDVLECVKVTFIACLFSELLEFDVESRDSFYSMDLPELWSVEWIEGDLTPCDSVAYSQDVIQKLLTTRALAAASKSDLEHLLQYVRRQSER